MATVSPPRPSADYDRKAQRAALYLGEELFGGACLLVGLAMSITLFLIPFGIPLALIGVAFLVSAAPIIDINMGDPSNR